MQAIILAAGKGTRCLPLTATRPKVLLKAANKTILEHNLEQLKGLVDDVIIVVGYMKEIVQELIGNRARYVEQKNLSGSGDALRQCEKMIKDRFILLNGDDFYSRDDIKKCIAHYYAWLVKKVDDPQHYGVVECKKDIVVGFEERPKKPTSNYASTGCFVADKSIFNAKLEKSKRGEFEAPDYMRALLGTKQVHAVQVQDYWIPIRYPWDLLGAQEILLDGIKTSIQGTVERNVVVKGPLVLGKNSVIKSGTYIEGPVVIGENCVVGPHAYIRGASSIGDNCKVGHCTELKNSILFDCSNIPHLSYIGDSVIGEHVNLGAGTTTANVRFDHGDVKSVVNKEKIPTGRKKLGAIVGDHAQTGIHTTLMPGVKLWNGVRVKANECVYEDVISPLSSN
ncbi:MAG TPA: bifunctional sugar-1-phosphate nucleotidylyltransferase/acetyltransferase [Candidatus Nanoarchaeia archaeon]|nr:bifunctional sugar-1-phosphate nucleotidylyltransferase/acetyltransferase [Candidatus Nanoarchaeia archaeon]